MPERVSAYADLIGTKRILFVPICVIIERMATMSSHLFWAHSADRLSNDTQSQLSAMLRRFKNDLFQTAEAYDKGKVGLFLGDWKQGKIKADRIFTDLLNNLRKVTQRASRDCKGDFGDSLKKLPEEWDRLYSTLEKKFRFEYVRRSSDTCNYFQSSNSTTWQRTMAATILALDSQAVYDTPDTHLILLCYARIKAQFLRQIEEMQAKAGMANKFDKDKILCASDADARISCPSCLRFTADIVGRSYLTERNQDTKLRTLYAAGR